MQRQVHEEMTIQATCRCGMQFTLEVHEYRGDWFMDITERSWPYRGGSACIRLKKEHSATPEMFLDIASRRLIPLMDEDLSRVDVEEGCRDHNVDYGEIEVGSRLGRRPAHLIIPTGPQEVTFLMAGGSYGINTQALVGCPGGLLEGWEDSGEEGEGDR